jgi:hypothetical protein
MTSKSTKKDYKALYNAQRNEANLLGKNLKQATQVVNELIAKLEKQDKQLAKYTNNGFTVYEAIEAYGDAWREIYSLSDELAKYKKAEKAYNLKFGLEETRLTSQEMKEIERRAREEEDEDDDRPLVPKKTAGKKSKPSAKPRQVEYDSDDEPLVSKSK